MWSTFAAILEISFVPNDGAQMPKNTVEFKTKREGSPYCHACSRIRTNFMAQSARSFHSEGRDNCTLRFCGWLLGIIVVPRIVGQAYPIKKPENPT